jgi:hypothetical protein
MVTPQSRASPISPLEIFPPADLIHRRTDGAEWATLLRVSRRQSNRDMEPLRVQRSHHLVASMLNGRLPSISRLTRRSPVVHGLFRPKRIQPNRSTPYSVNSDTANYLRAACPKEIFLSKSWTNGRVAQPRATSAGQPNARVIIAIKAIHSQLIFQFRTSANHTTFPFSSRSNQ